MTPLFWLVTNHFGFGSDPETPGFSLYMMYFSQIHMTPPASFWFPFTAIPQFTSWLPHLASRGSPPRLVSQAPGPALRAPRPNSAISAGSRCWAPSASSSSPAAFFLFFLFFFFFLSVLRRGGSGADGFSVGVGNCPLEKPLISGFRGAVSRLFLVGVGHCPWENWVLQGNPKDSAITFFWRFLIF